MPRVTRRKIIKLLVANRGEIACRIIRAARELGIRTVAVYSDADAGSLPVRMADEVVNIGSAEPAESYLNQKVIIDAARRTGCNAIHPGYGFLSENEQFAQQCRNAGLIFIGPTPRNIHDMGDKTIAKRIAYELGIPVIPGSGGLLESPARAFEVAGKIGYPVILKAVMGGGGRGMRVVRSDSELEQALITCQHEAKTSFGSDAIFMEKLIESPRHIEIQILADGHGNVIYLGERDCTIQRRHQKILEEAPSPALTSELRQAIGEAACRLATKADYLGVGTVEFLLDKNGKWYFMEMNTRIQVEHPVTEMVTGIDLIKQQIAVAEGEKLTFNQEDISINGHAIECRINAEDPMDNFLPAPGRIEQVIFPLGPGVRIDTAVFDGAVIPREYDSLIAKIIVHANTRNEAISRMKRALLELKISGVKSNSGFLFGIMTDPVFESGNFDINYIDANIERLNSRECDMPEVIAIAAAVETYFRIHADRQKRARRTPESRDAWTRVARSSIFHKST